MRLSRVHVCKEYSVKEGQLLRGSSSRSLSGLGVGEYTTWVCVVVVDVHTMLWLSQDGPLELVQGWSDNRLALLAQNLTLHHLWLDGGQCRGQADGFTRVELGQFLGALVTDGDSRLVCRTQSQQTRNSGLV